MLNFFPRTAFSGRWITLAALLLTASTQAQVPAAPDVGASSYILVDFHSGDTIAARDPELQVEPASITKLMTSYVVFVEIEAGRLSLADTVRISEKAWRTEGSRMFVEVDSMVSVEQLLKGVIIQSGNDASVALAEHIAGSEEVFAQMMNAEAERLGMHNTHFRNATGLPAAQHLTTAHDVARLARDMIARFPEFYRWYSEREYTYNGITQHNRNRLLTRDPSVDGLKTGHTEAAGYCLATSAVRDGMRLISVVMGTASESARASASQALLNYGFRFFETFKLYSAGDVVASAEVWKGRSDEIRLAVADDLFVTIARGRHDELAATLKIPAPAIAPFTAGQNFGELAIEFDGQTLLTHPLQVVDEVPAAGWWGRTADSVGLWFDGLFGGDD